MTALRTMLVLGLGLTVACAVAEPPAGLDTERRVWAALCASQDASDCPPPRRTRAACLEILERSASCARVRAIDSGRAIVDADVLDECLASMRCGGTTSACNRWLHGTVGEGASCEDDVVCADGLYCDRPPGSCGVCRRQVAVGEPCQRRAECAAPDDPSAHLTTYCRSIHEDISLPGICTLAERREVADGEPCGLVDVSTGHVLVPTCAGASACTTTADGAVCRSSEGAEGDPCAVEVDLCAGDLVCSLWSVCVPIGTQVGDRCDALDALAGCDATRGLTCIAGQCEPIPGSPGDLCNPSDPIPCLHGLVCGERTCGDALGLGSRCRHDSDCASRRCDRGTCTSLRCSGS